MKPLDEIDVLSATPVRRPSRLWLVPRTILPLLIIAAAVIGARMLIASKPEVPQRPAREQVYIVKTMPVALTDNRPMLGLFGTVTAARRIDLRTLVGGEVVAVDPQLRAGALVQAGTELLSIDRFTYEGAVVEARANLAEARSRLSEAEARIAMEQEAVARAREQLAFATRDLERARTLAARGTIAEKAVDDRELIVSQREQVLEQKESTVTIEKARADQQRVAIERLQWRLTQAERNLADTVLKAPFTGVVAAENVEVGRLVNVNDVAVSLYQADALEVRFSLSDRQYGRIIADAGAVKGRDVTVLWHVGDEPRRYRAVIERTGAEIAANRGGVDVYARILDIEAANELRPGAFVELEVPGRLYPQTVRLPETSVYNGDRVFVVENGRLAQRRIDIAAYENDVVIASGELGNGDVVLVTRIAEIGEGLKVRDEGTPAPDEPEKLADKDGLPVGTSRK